MRPSSLCALVAAGALSLTLGGATPSANADVAPHAVEAEATLELVNDVRATPTDCGAEGEMPAVEPLVLDERLSEAARLHAEEMRERGVIDHVGADGARVTDMGVGRDGTYWALALAAPP